MYFMPALSKRIEESDCTCEMTFFIFYDPNDVFWAMFHVDVIQLTIIYKCSVWVPIKSFYYVMYRKVQNAFKIT